MDQDRFNQSLPELLLVFFSFGTLSPGDEACMVGFGFGVTRRSMVRCWTNTVRQDIGYQGLYFITPVTG